MESNINTSFLDKTNNEILIPNKMILFIELLCDDICKKNIETLHIVNNLKNNIKTYQAEMTDIEFINIVKDRYMRITITNYIFSKIENIDTFKPNLDIIINEYHNFTIDKDKIDEPTKFIGTFFREFSAVLELKKNFDKSLLKLENKLKSIDNKINNISKEHTTILAIFTGIVITFIGGISLSNAVIQNIYGTNIYKLIMITSVLGMILYNIIDRLMIIIAKSWLDSESLKEWYRKSCYSNIAFIIILLIGIYCWRRFKVW